MKNIIPRKIKLGFYLSFLILIFFSAIIWFTLSKFHESNDSEARAYKILTLLEFAHSNVKDIQTGSRGFVITGKESFLEPYSQALGEIDSILTVLDNLIIDEEQKNRWANVKKLIYEKIEIQKLLIEVRKNKGLEAAEKLVEKEYGKKKMDLVKHSITEMMNREKELLGSRTNKKQESVTNIFIVSGFLVLLLAGANFAIYHILHQEFKAKKRTEELLKQTSDYTQMIVDTVPSPLVVLNANFKILSASRSFYNTFGSSKEQIENKSIFEIFDGKLNREELREKLSTIIPFDSSFNSYELPISADKIIRINARKLYRVGNHTMMILVGIDDITEKRDAVKQSQEYMTKLEELNQNKDKFFSIIAHDLKSPFASILGFAEILAGENDTLTKQEISEFSNYLLEAAKTIHRLLNDLLTWARIQGDQFHLEITSLNMERMINDVLSIYKQKASAKQIQLRYEGNTKEVLAKADKNSVETVLRNLISNALKFTHKNGQIVISAQSNEDFIELSVRDNGIGMDEKQLSKLFVLGNNNSSPGTNGETGTGLGLLLCKDLVEKNGGRIWVKSCPGEGSIFSFVLPACSETSLHTLNQ